MLPKIAFYFDVTVDELLNVDQVRVEEAIGEYKRQSAIYQNTGENEKKLALWEKAYSEFPSDCRVIEGLMFAINRDAKWHCSMGEAERIIALGEELMQRSTDTNQRENAIQCLCYTYDSIGDKEKALYYADMSGSFQITREDLRTTILDGEEGVKACQSYMMSLIHTAAMTASSMTAKVKFSHVEIIEAYQFAIDLINRLFSDGNVGPYAFDISYYYCKIAIEYANLGDSTNTLDALEESAKYAIMEAALTDMKYTAPMVNRLYCNHSKMGKNYKGNSCNLRIKALEDKKFDFVRNEQKFKRIVNELEKYVE
ncbi:MAG: hypothetical protein J6B85_12140 [Lachnospiraceae bacterium]|nr:hypothetical protein [Lachnospiraceae bacterium]